MSYADRQSLSAYTMGLMFFGLVSGLELFSGMTLPDVFHLGPAVIVAVGAVFFTIPAIRRDRGPQALLVLAFFGLFAWAGSYGIFWYLTNYPIQLPDLAAVSHLPTKTPLRP
jgi:hypothetical protein